MLKHVYLIFIATFVFGFFAGAILYLINHTGKEGAGAIDTETGMIISAKMYGGCARLGCASYRIENNGSYVYIDGGVSGDEGRYEDKLTSRQLKTLKTAIDNTNFDALDDSEFLGTCPADYDGVAYTYTIQSEGEDHEVDSCIEVTEGEALFKILEEYFDVFRLLSQSE